jgi:hypothetical protein
MNGFSRPYHQYSHPAAGQSCDRTREAPWNQAFHEAGMKIFWSWQSDTPGKIGRHFVRDALLEAIATLKQPDEIEERTQAENRESMHLDQDRQDVTGSPPLVDTIKQKIRDAAVFLGDVTPVSTIPKRKSVVGSKQKRNMNPNVATN